MRVGEKKSIPASIEPEKSSSAAPSPCFCINPVGLNSVGINLEDKGSLFIVEGIEINSYLVITLGLVSLSNRCPDCFWAGIEAADSNVKIFFIISHVNHSFFRWLSTFLRFVLSEGVKDSSLLPERVFQLAVNFGRRCEFWNYDIIFISFFLRKREKREDKEANENGERMPFSYLHIRTLDYVLTVFFLKAYLPITLENLMFFSLRLIPRILLKRANERL